MYKCPGCGAALRFDPKTQLMTCDHCMRTMDPQDPSLTYIVQASGETGVMPQEGEYQTIVYTCPNCGGTVLSTDETAATFCSYCGASVLLEGRLDAEMAPQVIIPFRIGKDECKAAYKRLLGRAVFAPNYMKADTEIEKFRGIYMPYWIYSFRAEGTASGTGETTHRAGDYVIHDHYQVSRYISSTYEGISYDAASSFSDVMSDAIAPFRAVGANKFTPTYMSGFYADVSDVPSEVYLKDADQIARNYMAEQTAADSAFSSHGVSASSVAESIPTEAVAEVKGYFPVWFLANRVRGKKNLISYAVVNGETGKISADIPIAFWKYILGSLIAAVPLFFLFNTFITLTPGTALIATLILSVVSFFVVNSQMNKAYTQENQLNDQGLAYVEQMTQQELMRRQAAEAAATPEAREEIRKEGAEEQKKQTSKALKKVLMVFGIVAAIIAAFILVNFFDREVLYTIAVAGAVLAVIVWTIASMVKSSRRKRGIQSSPAKKKIGSLIKPILAFALSIIILIVNPVQDIFYYGAAGISLAMIIWCAFDAVRWHNRAVFRPIPQFGKRGGGDRA